jgi:hypothetical protein
MSARQRANDRAVFLEKEIAEEEKYNRARHELSVLSSQNYKFTTQDNNQFLTCNLLLTS